MQTRTWFSSLVVGGVGALLLFTAHASGQAVVSRITGQQPWRAANGDSDAEWFPERNEMAISADDRWVVFESQANNLILYDRNIYSDIFVYEIATGRIVGITSNQWVTANAWSYDPSISADGRYVVFASNASNLVPSDFNNNSDVFVADRDSDGNGIFDEQAPVFERISVDSAGNETHGACISPTISDDGMRVLFLSDASDLVANDNNGVQDAFLHDRSWGTTERVDVDSGGNEANFGCSVADLSADGQFVVFSSRSDNLVLGDNNGAVDIFLRDLANGTTARISLTNSSTEANGDSQIVRHCISIDPFSSYISVAYQSNATNLVPGDLNSCSDAFVSDFNYLTGRWFSLLLSHNWCNNNQANGACGSPTLSLDGYTFYYTFVSLADNIGLDLDCDGSDDIVDGNGMPDVFMENDGNLKPMSVAAGGTATSNLGAGAATVGPHGVHVAFSSASSDICSTGDVAGFRDVFLGTFWTGANQYVTALPAGDANGPSMNGQGFFDSPAARSADGRFVAFQSDANNLVDSDGNGFEDVFVADRTTGAMIRVSVSSNGGDPNGPSFAPAISADGRFVAFASQATNLTGSDANGGIADVFLRDRDPDANGVFDEGNETTTLLSVDSSGVQGNGWSDHPSISADGRRIAFDSYATNLSPIDGNFSLEDVFVRDVSNGQTYLASVNSAGSSSGSGSSQRPSLSADGNAVAFSSTATDLAGVVVTGSDSAVYVHRLDNGHTDWIAGGANSIQSYCVNPCLSSDGLRVSYVTEDWPNSRSLIGVKELPPNQANVETIVGALLNTSCPSMNSNGRCVTFCTGASLTPIDSNGAFDVYLLDVEQDESGTVSGLSDPILASQNPTGNAGNSNSILSSPSDDGNYVVLVSDASDLVANDTNNCRDVLLYDRTHVARWSNYGSGFAGPHAIPTFTVDAPPVLSSTIPMSLANSSGIPVAALVYLGTHSANDPFPWGATLLVDLATAISFVVPLDAVGATLVGDVPNDASLSGVSVYLQALERDDVVPHRLSFTPGLELHFGN